MNPPASSTRPWIEVPARLGRKTLLLISALLTLARFPAPAEILFSERFTYPDGPVGERAAPVWRTLTGTPGKIRIDNGALRAAEGEFEIVETFLEGRPHSDATLYASFTLTVTTLPTGTGAYVAAFSAADGPRTVGRVLVTSEGAAPGTYRLGVSTLFPRPLAILPDELQLNTAYRVLIRLVVSPVASPGDFPFRSTLWLNPASEAEGGLQAPDYTPIPGAIAGFAFRQGLKDDEGNGMGAVTLDDLVVATTFEEAKAGPPPEPQWTYTSQAGAVTITGYTGEGGYVRVPERINGLPVTRVGSSAFSYKHDLRTLTLPSGLVAIEATAFQGSPITHITIPAGVKAIEFSTFQSCRELTNVVILGPITNISQRAFASCSKLAHVTYPDSLKHIDHDAFGGCSSLLDISLPEGLIQIGNGAFGSCSSLKTNQGTLRIPSTVTGIGIAAFGGCTNLEAFAVDPLNALFSSRDGILMNKRQTTLILCPAGRSGHVVIPVGVTAIQMGAFQGCQKLTRVSVPESIKGLPENAFFGASSLTRIDLPSGLTSLGEGVFYFTGLTNVSLPAGVRTIPRNAYAGCKGLTTVTLPEQITRVEEYAFLYCDNLTEINIPRTVTTLGTSFVSSARLSSINVAELNPAYVSLEGVLFNKARTTLLLYPRARAGNYQIPNGVRTLGVAAFAGAAFTSIAIPASVTSIQERAFEFCYQLTELTIPDTVTSLGFSGFRYCDRLTSVRVGRGITTLPPNAFSFCWSLSDVKLPDTLRTISELAFYECPRLHRLTIPASVRTFQGVNIFGNGNSGTDLLELYFEGNAPSASLQALVVVPEREDLRLTAYYRAGTTGWKATFAGRPTVLWDPQVAGGDGAPGFRDGKFGFTLTGAPGLPVAVEACTDLTNPVWVRLGTHVLTDGTAPFLDADSANHPGRFYRFQFP